MINKYYYCFVVFFSCAMTTIAQDTIVKGSVVDAAGDVLEDVSVAIANTDTSAMSGFDGTFTLTGDVASGEQLLVLVKVGYQTLTYPITVESGQLLSLDPITMELESAFTEELLTVTLSDDQINDESGIADNVSGLLQASRDVFLSSAAFDFSGAFFRVRGYDSQNATVMINGIEMNRAFSGRPQWNNWGGLNDVTRNQELANGLTPSDYTFGGVLGSTNINMRASKYRQGGRVSYASSNRSYTNRIMASYSSGLRSDGWAFTLSAGRRWGDEGFVDGTLYDANSFMTSIEKVMGNHSLNFTSIYTPNRRGVRSSNTQEVIDLRGIRYNSNWGYFKGEKRNSRIREIDEPIVMLNHYWDMGENTQLNTNVAYQWGSFGNQRLDNNGTRAVTDASGQVSFVGGAVNPSPAYYQRLPSFFLQNDDLEGAFLAQQEFVNNGQLNWDAILEANQNLAAQGGNSLYALTEDRSDDKTLAVSTIFTSDVTDNITLNASVSYRNLESENFANVVDLLGGTGYLDVNQFLANPVLAPNDANNPFRTVGVGDRFRYNYVIDQDVIGGFAQAQFKFKRFDFFLGGNVSHTSFQREGLFNNPRFPGSLGKGEEESFTNYGVKGGLSWKVSGRNIITANAGYLTEAPTLRNSYLNAREANNLVPDLQDEKITTADLTYVYRSPLVKARVTGYYTLFEDATDVSFFFAEFSQGSGFVQETVTGVDRRHIGAEIGLEAQVTPTIKVKGVAALGQFTFDKDSDNVFITTDSEELLDNTNQDRILAGVNAELGPAAIKDYRVANGPQNAYSVGFEYRDPDFWWFGATANFFTHSYIDIAPGLRTESFFLDADGLPINNVDPAIARSLLQQQRLDDYMLANLVGGKSWKVGDYFIGLFASINNVFAKKVQTGGFEQSRNANYNSLLEDVQSGTPLFGPRLFSANGTTYFVNVNFRF